MSIPPDWQLLLALTDGLKDISADNNDSVIPSILNTIVDSIPNAQTARLYAVNGDRVHLVHSTDNATGEHILLVIDGISTNTIWIPEDQQWIMPILSGSSIHGLLELIVPDIDEDWSVWLKLFVQQLSAQWKPSQQPLDTQSFATRLMQTHQTLTKAQNYDEMARAILAGCPTDVEAVAIALFDRKFGKTGIPNSLTSQAISSRNNIQIETKTISIFSATEDARITYFLNELVERRMMLLWSEEHPQQLPAIANRLISALQETGVQHITALGLNINHELSGLLFFASQQDLREPGPTSDGLQTLADQLAVIIEYRTMLASNETNFSQLARLRDVNHAISLSENTVDILQVLSNVLAHTSSTVFMVGIDHSPENNIESLRLKYLVDRKDQTVTNDVLGASPEEKKQLQTALSRLETSIDYAPDGNLGIHTPTAALMTQYEMKCFACIYVTVQDRIENLIYIVFDSFQSFDEGTRQLYDAVAQQTATALENQRLKFETQTISNRLADQVNSLQLLSDIAITISSMRDEESLLSASTKAFVDILRVDHSAIVLFETNQATGTVASEYPDLNTLGVQIDLKDTPLFAATDNSPVTISNIQTDSRLSDNSRSVLLERNIASMLIIPFIDTDGNLYGSVGMDVYDIPRGFNLGEIRIAQILAAQTAVGIQNVRLLAATQRRGDQLLFINRASQRAQQTLDVDELLQLIVATFADLAEIDHMTIHRHDLTMEDTWYAAIWNKGDPYDKQWEPSVLQPDSLVYDAVAANKNTYIVEANTLPETYYPYTEALGTLLAMPMFTQGQLIGVICLGAIKPISFPETEQVIYQQLVNQMSVALANAQSYSQTQRLAQNKSLASDIALQLQRQNDLRDMIDVTVKQLGAALGARRGRVRMTIPEASDNRDDA